MQSNNYPIHIVHYPFLFGELEKKEYVLSRQLLRSGTAIDSIKMDIDELLKLLISIIKRAKQNPKK
jgi:hypothetical protein